jgi:hypothetical protein
MSLSSESRTLLFRGERVAAELTARRPNHRRFVVAIGFKDAYREEPSWPTLPWRFRVTSFEVATAKIGGDLDSDSVEDWRTEVVAADVVEGALTKACEGKPIVSAHVVGAPSF